MSGVGGDGCGGLYVYVGVSEQELRGTGCIALSLSCLGHRALEKGRGNRGHSALTKSREAHGTDVKTAVLPTQNPDFL